MLHALSRTSRRYARNPDGIGLLGRESEIGKANGRCILFCCQQAIDNRIKYPLRTAVANTQKTRCANSIVDRKAEAHQWHTKLAGNAVPLAVANEEIRREAL